MFNGFLSVGGNEVVNSERTYGYANSTDCPVQWLDDPECGQVADAEGDEAYLFGNIDDAPWYDSDISDLSSRFLGLYGVDIAGLSDSTRSAVVTQRNGDGAVVSGYRHGPREVRVRGWMTAMGTDALEYGMTWLRNVLEPSACGQHGSVCGESDAAFFVDCPPARTSIDYYTTWGETRRNLFPDPRAVTATATYWNASSGTLSREDGALLGEQYVARFTQTAAGAQRAGLLIQLTPSTTYTVRFRARGSVARSSWTLAYRITPTGADHPSISAPVTINTEVGTYEYVFTTGATAPGATTGIYFVNTNGNIAETLEITDVAIELGDTTGQDFFDGETPDLLDPYGQMIERYSWVGAANASASIKEVRERQTRGQTDDEYAVDVDPYRRFLHSVRCISGPFVVQEAVSRDGKHVGRLVEFTLLSEVPYVYGIPKELDVPPIVPTVVQDIAYNLAPYPSAELAGAAMIAATNYVTNPSLETNATGWGRVAGTGVLDANLVAARVTGELAAVGTASFRTVFTATNSGTNGYFGNNQPTPIAIPTATGTRVSISCWSAAVIMAGTPTITELHFFAFWTDSGGAIIGNTDLGGVPAAGGAVSVKSIVPIAGAAGVVVEARCLLGSWVSGNVIRLYTDALAVTVP